MLLVAGIAMGAAFARSIGGIVPSLDQSTRVSGPTTVTLTGSDTLILYAPTGMMPTCDILGPTSQVPSIDLGTTHYAFTVGGVTYESIARLGGPGEPGGEYVVECQEEGLILAPPLNVGGIVAGVLVLLGAIGAGVLGGTLLIVGLVLWLAGRRHGE